MRALDLSYGVEQVTPAWCRVQQAKGVRLLIANLWTGNSGFPAAEQALRSWREAGGLTAGYFVVHRWRTLAEHYSGAQQSAGSEWDKLRFVAIDVERVSPQDPLAGQVSPEMVDEAATWLSFEGLRYCVYTSQAMWRAITADSQECDGLPLWDAHYTGMPDLSAAPGYGGWERRIGHQYVGTTNVDGIACDLSIFDDAFVEDGMTAQQDAEIRSLIGPLRSWAALETRRADAAAQAGYGITDSLGERRATELASFADRLEALLE